MKWEQGVRLDKHQGYQLILNDSKKQIEPEDEYIADAVSKELSDEELLILVGKNEQTDDIISGFRIAQFVVDYGEFISNDVGHMEIES